MSYFNGNLRFYKNKIILYSLFSNFYISLLGKIAVCEFIAIIDFLSIKNVIIIFRKVPHLKKICIAYLLFFISQFISDFYNNSEINNELRGWANILMSILVLTFLTKYLYKSSTLIISFLTAQIFSILIFNFSEYSFYPSENASFKFFLVPMLNNIVLIIAWMLNCRNNNSTNVRIVWLFILYGLFCVFFDFRSNGVFMILTGILYYKRNLFYNLNIGKLMKILVLFCLIVQVIFSVFVFQILSGKIENHRTKMQLELLDNPYNLLSLMVVGRAETFIAIEAIKDKPILGHGSWAPDPNGKYNYLLAVSQKVEKSFDQKYDQSTQGFIPSHSVLLGAWMTAGIVGFLAIGFILILFIKSSLQILKIPSDLTKVFIPIVIFFMLNGIWNFLFSPLAHLRQTLPIMIAFIIILNQKMKLIPKKH